METTFEALGGTYHKEGDYLIPNIEVPESPKIGIWGERRRRYLREHEKATYTAMLLSGTLNSHLEEVDRGLPAKCSTVWLLKWWHKKVLRSR